MKCTKCGTNNGITMYVGKVCKRCGKELIIKFPKSELNEGGKE